MGKTDLKRFEALLIKLAALGLATTPTANGDQVAYITQDDLPRAVPLEDFFIGNPNTCGTFAANLIEHPGEAALYALCQQVRQRPDVHDILVGVTQIEYHPTTLDQDWAYADALYIVTTAQAREIAPEATQTDAEIDETVLETGWFGKFFPDEIAAIDYETAFTREGLLPPPPGYRIYLLYWD